MKRILYFLVLASLMSSCVEVIEPELEDIEPKVVIEGLITNLPGRQFVKVTQTNSFYTKQNPPAINHAIVIITENTGFVDTLEFNPETERYESPGLLGTPGNVYDLRVIVNGKVYQATSRMEPVTTIDGVVYNYYQKQDFIHQVGYYLAFMAKEPRETTDFYLWKFYKNGELIHDSDDLHIASDEGIKEDIVGLEAPYVYNLGDTATVEMYSITEEAYKFYESLNNNLNNDGGFFSSPPANPPSNISNGALGLFQVSAVEVSKTIVE